MKKSKKRLCERKPQLYCIKSFFIKDKTILYAVVVERFLQCMHGHNKRKVGHFEEIGDFVSFFENKNGGL